MESTIAFTNLLAHLDERGILIREVPEDGVVLFPVMTDVAMYQAIGRVEDELFQLNVRVPVVIPEACRVTIAETITRANYGNRIGAFMLDMRDGELCYHASTILESDRLDDQVANRLIRIVLKMLDRYTPAVLSVIYANESPEDAVRRVECDPSSSD